MTLIGGEREGVQLVREGVVPWGVELVAVGLGAS